MLYSIAELFALISQDKDRDEFYYEPGGPFGADYYIERITGFRPEGLKILWGYCEETPLKGLNTDEKSICLKEQEVLVFTYIGHIEDFEITRMKDPDMAIRYLCSNVGLINPFTSDISIIAGNRRLKYYVTDRDGHILTRENMRSIKDFSALSDARIKWI